MITGGIGIDSEEQEYKKSMNSLRKDKVKRIASMSNDLEIEQEVSQLVSSGSSVTIFHTFQSLTLFLFSRQRFARSGRAPLHRAVETGEESFCFANVHPCFKTTRKQF